VKSLSLEGGKKRGGERRNDRALFVGGKEGRTPSCAIVQGEEKKSPGMKSDE